MAKLKYLFSLILCFGFLLQVCAETDLDIMLSSRIDEVSKSVRKLKHRFKKLDATVETLNDAIEKFVENAKNEISSEIIANIKTTLDFQTIAVQKMMENERVILQQSKMDLNEKFDTLKDTIQTQVTSYISSNFNQVSENIKPSIRDVENKLQANLNATYFRIEALEEKCFDSEARETFADTGVRTETSQTKDNQYNAKCKRPEKTYRLSEKEKEGIKKVFAITDLDNSSTVSVDEFKRMMRITNPNNTEQDNIDKVNKVDLNRNSELDFDEYLELWPKIKDFKIPDEEIDLVIFKLFDRDDDGFINEAELQYMLADRGLKFSELEIHYLMVVVDTNRNGQVDFDEYYFKLKNLGRNKQDETSQT